MLEDVYDFLGRFLIFPVDHFRSVVTRNLINNSRNRGLRGKFHLEIVQGEIRISDSKYDLQFVLLCYFLNNSRENRRIIYSLDDQYHLFTSLQIIFLKECTTFSNLNKISSNED